jgi:alpha-glucoside transport system substrate-binding protein
MRLRTATRLAALAFASSLLASGCLGQEAAGERVEVFGAISGELESKLVADSLAEFSQESGIEVEYVPSPDFTTLIRSRVQGGNPPPVALFPQPGLLLDLAEGGRITPLDDVDVDLDKLRETLIPGFLDAATLEGKVYGAPMSLAPKSLVWYPKPEFEAAGYEVPTTHAELLALTKEIRDKGEVPWCIGIESGPDTGWPATDWLEDYVLRTAGPDVYDRWVTNEVKFSSPEIKRAAEAVGEIFLTQGNVRGGGRAILNTPFGDAPKPMFEDPPACWLHRQASFITSFFPEDVQANLDERAGVFVLPPVEGGFDGTPILGSGNFAALLDADNENAVKVVQFLASDQFGGPWAKAKGGGFFSPHTTFDVDQYPDEITRETGRQANEADVFRFDGSDLMPAQVGAGTFWRGMVDWVGGRKNLDQVLSDIDASWPSS